MDHPPFTFPPRTGPRRLSTGGLLCALLSLAAFCACAPSGAGTDGRPTPTSATPKEQDSSMSGTSGQAAVSKDVNELRRLVNLPYEPRSAIWQRRARGSGESGAAPGPTDWSVVCVLELSEEDAARLVADATRQRPAAAKKVKVLEWFPEEVRRRAGDDQMLEGQGFDAGLFYKSPLTNGSLVRVPETNYFVLGLYTM